MQTHEDEGGERHGDLGNRQLAHGGLAELVADEHLGHGRSEHHHTAEISNRGMHVVEDESSHSQTMLVVI
jgi:hypothetical protein